MCIFCEIVSGNIPSSKVYEDENVLAILDISQATYGHTIVLPKKHVANILEADDSTIDACMNTAAALARRIVKSTGAKGVNILTNCGEAAGQSVDHLHFHILPRYDENDGVHMHFDSHEDTDLDSVLKTING